MLFLTIPTASFSFVIYKVGDQIQGKEYNDVLKRWIMRYFSIWVGIDDNQKEYIIFQADTALKQASVMINYNRDIKQRLKTALNKAIKWCAIAKKNKVNTIKSLDCYGDDEYNLCKKDGVAFEEIQMGMLFFDANDGKQTNLVISIVDRNNQFIKSEIYFNLDETKKMLNNIQKIDATIEQARKNLTKQNLFK